MEEQRNTTPAWEAMEVEETGHVGEVLQGSKISQVQKGNVVADSFED